MSYESGRQAGTFLDLERTAPLKFRAGRKTEDIRYTPGGNPIRIVELQLPRIPDDLLRCVVYLYPDIDSAAKGNAIGGTGFITSVPNARTPGLFFHYFVTNRHVVDGGSTVIRLNRAGGGFDIIEAHEQNWTVSPDGDDLAICPISFGSSIGNYDIKAVGQELYLTQDIIAEFEIGPGDDTYVVGRFVSHEGREKNLPAVRFGNISQMPIEPIRHQWGYRNAEQESFLVEARSIPGYSGSPVFVHIPAMSNRPSRPQLVTYELGTWFLGVDWAHLNDFAAAYDKTGKELPFQVKSNSGMMAVVPAWRLSELINSPKVKGERDAWYAEQDKANAATPSVSLDSTGDLGDQISRFNKTIGVMLATPPSPRRGGDKDSGSSA